MSVKSHPESSVPCEQRFRQAEISRADGAERLSLPPVIRSQFEAILRRHQTELLTQLEHCWHANDTMTTGAGASLGLEDVVLPGYADKHDSQSLRQLPQPVEDTLGIMQSQTVAVSQRVEPLPHEHVAERAATEHEAEANNEPEIRVTCDASTEGDGQVARKDTPESANPETSFNKKKFQRRFIKSIMNSNDETPATHSLIHRLVKGPPFEIVMNCAVLLNAAFIGFQVQNSALRRGTPLSEEQENLNLIIELIFVTIFCAELLMRVRVEGSAFLFGQEVSWNVFDSFIVAMMLLQLIADAASSSLEASGVAPLLRLIRICRLVRLLRVVKVLKSLRELRIMVASILSSIRPLFWVCVLFLLFFYVFGIALTVGTVEHLTETGAWDKTESEALIHHFATVDASILSLFESMTGGISWGELFDAVQPLPALYPSLYLAFVILALLALVNVVTGVFVDSAMQNSKDDADLMIQQEIEKKQRNVETLGDLFDEVDTENRGSVTEEQLITAFANERMQAFLQGMGLSVGDADHLFHLLDRDKQGSVSTEEFLNGLVKLLGNASALDLAQMRLEGKVMLQNTGDLMKLVQDIHEKTVKDASRLVDDTRVRI